jgi:hypothetical protein
MSHLKNKFLTTCLLVSTTSQAMLIKRLTLSTNRFPAQTARHISRSYSYKNYLCPGLEALNKASNGKSIIFQESKENPSLDSEYLDKMISDAIKHYKKADGIKQLELNIQYLEKSLTPYAFLPVMQERLKKEKENYPYYRQEFSKTLSNDDEKQLQSIVIELTKHIPNDKLVTELSYLNSAFLSRTYVETPQCWD